MGKFETKKEKKRNPLPWILLVVILVAALAFAAVKLLPGQETPAGTEPAQTEQTEEVSAEQPTEQTQAQATVQTEPQETEPENQVSLPLSLDDGRLELKMLFQYSGVNPDCDNQEGKNVAAVQLVNTSGQYLAEAKLSLTLLDGTQLEFVVTEVPAGDSVIAFSVDNQTIPADPVCTGAACEATFEAPDATANGKLIVSMEGVTVTVDNISGGDLKNVVVYCRSLFGEDYFGGVTYQYTIDEIPAGGSATVEAWDCILGMAEVVRVHISES